MTPSEEKLLLNLEGNSTGPPGSLTSALNGDTVVQIVYPGLFVNHPIGYILTYLLP